MSRVFITGSTGGLGLAAARTLIAEGHEVVLHARSSPRAGTLFDLAARSAGVVIGDLGSAAETRSVAEQVRGIGRMDAVIHNAGIYREPGRGITPEGRAKTLAVNTLAPYLLTAWIERPDRRARFRGRPEVAERAEPCRRSGLGPHQDGRCRCP
jgi:NAD(P)-dependent dehydrogenase (short-subunit alcohol dehydrogenase family)